MTVISYPIPLYQNVDINTSLYTPRFSVISGITLGKTTTITTSSAHTLVLGQTVRFTIPPGYGTRQLNGQQGVIIEVVSTTEVKVAIDSQGYDAFIAASLNNSPLILPIGDQNEGAINSNAQSVQTYINGSFRNIG